MSLSPFRTRKCGTQASFLLNTQDVSFKSLLKPDLLFFVSTGETEGLPILPSDKTISPAFSCATTQNCISSLSTDPGLTWGF